MSQTEAREGAVGPPSGAARPVRIFHVDDHPAVSQALEYATGEEQDLRVCGSARSVPEALEAIRRCEPGVVVVDIAMPGVSGLELVRTLREERPRLPVVVFSMWDEVIFAERALRAGALGYVMKSEPVQAVLRAVRRALAGQITLSEAMTTRLLGRAAGVVPPGDEAPDSIPSRLTDRELEVFRLIGQGCTVRAAAAALKVSPKTVESHCGSIKRKLGLRNAVELQQRAALWVNAPPS